ncbi:MAG TPA: DUF308 domain-containing protein [Pyrinomonadaceae bacterium]|jgi:uncharacterized membrane protein HdeD (DUF308 family)
MATLPIVNAIAKYWWVLFIRGLLALLFGIMAVAWPGPTLMTLVLLYGAYTLVDGITALWVGGTSRAWPLVLAGVIGIIIGIYTFLFLGITSIALLYLIAVWALIRGIFEIVTAIQLRKEISNEWMLIIGGIISIIFGLVLFASPLTGALAMILIIGCYAIVFGGVMIVLAFRLRGLPNRLERSRSARG